MPDDNLEIAIKLLADTHGADEVRAALDKVKGSTEELGEAEEKTSKFAELMHHNHRAVHQILHLIGHESGPGMGAALAGAAAVGTGSILLLVMAARELFEQLKQVNESQEKIIESAQKGYPEAQEALQKFKEEAIKSNEAFVDSQKVLDERLSSTLEKLGFIKKAMEELNPQNKPAVDKEFQDLSVGAMEIRLKEMLKSRAEAESSFARESKGMTPDEIKQRTANLPRDIAELNKQIDELGKQIAEASPKSYGKEFWMDIANNATGGRLGGVISRQGEEKQAELDSLQARIEGRLTDRRKLQSEALGLTGAETSESTIKKLDETIQKLISKIDTTVQKGGGLDASSFAALESAAGQSDETIRRLINLIATGHLSLKAELERLAKRIERQGQ